MLPERLVAHRGFQKNFPENTLLAMTKAIEAGARFIEMDIQFTSDAQPVLYHDLIMKRVSNQETLINSISLNEAINCPAYEPARLGEQFIGQTITPLTAITAPLTANPNVKAFVELKPEAVELLGVKKTYQQIEQCLSPVLKQCILISLHRDFIDYVSQQQAFTFGIVAKKWADIQTCNQLKPTYVFCNKQVIPVTADLNALPFYLVVYEVGDALDAKYWFDRGADMIETFDIGGVLSELGHQAL